MMLKKSEETAKLHKIAMLPDPKQHGKWWRESKSSGTPPFQLHLMRPHLLPHSGAHGTAHHLRKRMSEIVARQRDELSPPQKNQPRPAMFRGTKHVETKHFWQTLAACHWLLTSSLLGSVLQMRLPHNSDAVVSCAYMTACYRKARRGLLVLKNPVLLPKLRFFSLGLLFLRFLKL